MTARKPWDHNGRSSKDRGYGREHRKLREQLLSQEPLCRMCQQRTPPCIRVATIADHIVGIARGGAVHDINNLQPVCFECHQDKSNADKGHRVRRRITLSGWPE